MLIPNNIRECAVFFVQERTDLDSGKLIKQSCATGFVVSVPITDKAVAQYLVTARHVLDCAGYDTKLFVRLNTVSGVSEVEVDTNDWIRGVHDVAVLPFSHSPEWKLVSIPFEMLLPDDQIDSTRLREGNDVCFVSLFSPIPGKKQAQPIVRFGRIACMPYEDVRLSLGPQSFGEKRVYLVESLSWGGASGAPVFVDYFNPTLTSASPYGAAPFRLLGVNHGHFSIEEEVAGTGDLGEGKVSINAGISAIVPAQELIDLLLLDELKEQREALVAEIETTDRGSIAQATFPH